MTQDSVRDFEFITIVELTASNYYEIIGVKTSYDYNNVINVTWMGK